MGLSWICCASASGSSTGTLEHVSLYVPLPVALLWLLILLCQYYQHQLIQESLVLLLVNVESSSEGSTRNSVLLLALVIALLPNTATRLTLFQTSLITAHILLLDWLHVVLVNTREVLLMFYHH